MKGIEKSDMQRIREIGEKFLSTLLLIFISSCYFIQDAQERIQYLNIDDTGARCSSEIQEKSNGRKKHFLKKICVTKRVNSSGRMMYLRVYFGMKKILRAVFSKG